ncbi:hypothetical protein [Clostridium manihotivorum]|uniref:HD domain-containing protein n=1 Tax=Clostridium manihotivorum TaxID=2320868 RepID=A0A410DZ48_9CLOT|nr:hypothetical protein [Clostridium manihotivorum]QAA34343.1 hypothetical protein C1I91_23370 [Clostridium manihotivorum]
MIDEKIVLDFYIDQINNDTIYFLKNKPWFKEDISKEILKLRGETEMHNKITICKKLWKLLFEASMSFIDNDRRGYDDLFNYFDTYVDFEELIFASDSFYRDHTMHCLWVYFLGEYLIKNEDFKPFFNKYGNDNEFIFEMCQAVRNTNLTEAFHSFIELEDIMKSIEGHYDSLRCLTALTHDLGYPIKKITSITKNIKSILPHFGINNTVDFQFNYSDIHANLIKDFLNFLSYNYIFYVGDRDRDTASHILPKVAIINELGSILGIDETKLLELTKEEIETLKNGRVNLQLLFDYSRHMRYSKDFENYQHGIMSAFLLFRKLSIFNNTPFAYRDLGNIQISKLDFVKKEIITELLIAITDHTSEGFQISKVSSDSAFLTFIDELEEFSRISRANQNRQYVNEFCKTDIYVENGYLNIDFIFDSTKIDNLDPERAFKGRCKRFLTLFNIKGLDENFKLKLRCIGKLPYDTNVYMLEIRNKFANITINDEEKNIRLYLKSNQFMSKEEYAL